MRITNTERRRACAALDRPESRALVCVCCADHIRSEQPDTRDRSPLQASRASPRHVGGESARFTTPSSLSHAIQSP